MNLWKFGTAVALAVSPAFAAGDVHWSYSGHGGPEHWGELKPEFATCSTGKQQSPIDLAQANTVGQIAVSADYKSAPLTILNNGHTVQVNFPAGSTMTSAGHEFYLLQVHFHTPSEEAINGKRFPMVAHFVHKDAKGALGVLGVFYEEGAANADLAKIIAAAPKYEKAAALVAGVTINPADLIPSTLNVYRFQGSLTTPPCSEGVNWHVAQTTVTVSADQIRAMNSIMGNNARPIQPLNGRLVVAPAN
jgi:carbonic anhydrase